MYKTPRNLCQKLSLSLLCVTLGACTGLPLDLTLPAADGKPQDFEISLRAKVRPTPKPSQTPISDPPSVPGSGPTTTPSQAPPPSSQPSQPSQPSDSSAAPTSQPTPAATVTPQPTPVPTVSAEPTAQPTPLPTAQPTPVPTALPTPLPTATPVPTAVPPAPPTTTPGLGLNASLGGRLPFPADNAWNQTVDSLPVAGNSDVLIASMGLNTSFHPDFGANWNGGPFGIPYMVVSGSQPKVPIHFTDYGDESDPGPYPFPPNAAIEGGPDATGDRHILVVDKDNWKLYETFYSFPSGNGYNASSGAVYDLSSNALRPAGWTSADAAGLPVFPGLVRYDEVVERGEINHALRFTASRTRRAYIHPARHYASSRTDVNLPPMGLRVRLKASVDISSYPASAQVVLRALKKYGMILADNGSNWYVSGTADARWNDSDMNTLKRIKGSQFEVVETGPVITDSAQDPVP